MSEEFVNKLNQFEEKWQKKWEENKIFEVNPENKDKFFITVAYPYPSGGMHIGHVRTFTLPDVFARFKRMQGNNVLFPMAWHVTGTPIIGALDRLKEGEEKQLEVLRDVYNVPEETLDSFEEPMDFANYFIENSYKKNMKKLGFSVDWRREFTTNDDQYNKFIEWQYKRLSDKGLVKQGMHPTKYDTKSENPVTTHDLLEGEDAEKQDYTLVKFTDDEGTILPMATLRPETVYGATHVMVAPEEKYIKCDVDNETWILSPEAVEKIRLQNREVQEIEEIKGEELIGKAVQNPVTNEKVIVLPAEFIDTDSGTGLVMSVPGHAPYDWISLQDLKKDEEKLKKYNLDVEKVRSIESKQIINIEGFDDVPAREVCSEYGIESQNDKEALEQATEELYEKEFHKGTLNSVCGEFEGQKVNAVKDQIIEKFEQEGSFSSMYDFSEKVVSRSGGKVVVSLEESWFLEYNDKAWKDKVHKNLDNMRVIPEDKRDSYNHTIDWLESWPCIRNYGLGTEMPFDKDFIIEPLSDSTIYMAFYTIRHIVEDINAEKLEPEFFDYVFNEEGSLEEVSELTGIEKEIIKEARESFDYWYPLDWRTSGEDLVQNHLTFMMYHHTALFGEENWPQGVATWGMGTLEGEKMSSSKGHVVLPDEAINNYGADTVRFFLFASVEPWQDFDWRADEVEKYKNKIRNFYNRTEELYNTGETRDKNNLDKYALSRLQKIVKEATTGLEDFQTRKAGLQAFFELNNLIKDYQKRSKNLNEDVINQMIETQIKLLAPFMPHICEELWKEIDGSGLVSEAEWPEAEEELIEKEIENKQKIVKNTVDDIREVSELVENFEEIKIILASDWKRETFKELQEVVDERKDFGEAMNQLVEGRKEHAEFIKSSLQEYMNNPDEIPYNTSQDEEENVIKENIDYISSEFDAKITLETEEESSEDKSDRAEPGKPAIVLY